MGSLHRNNHDSASPSWGRRRCLRICPEHPEQASTDISLALRFPYSSSAQVEYRTDHHVKFEFETKIVFSRFRKLSYEPLDLDFFHLNDTVKWYIFTPSSREGPVGLVKILVNRHWTTFTGTVPIIVKTTAPCQRSRCVNRNLSSPIRHVTALSTNHDHLSLDT